MLTLAAWFVASTLVSATLLARHLIPLPDGAALDPRLGALRPADAGSGWLLVHVLYAECPCSERIVHHLAQRGRIAGASEVVLWVGDAPALEAELVAAHFPIQRADAGDLRARFGIEAVPLLAILSPENVVRYRGGYAARKQAYEIGDVASYERARSGLDQRPMPIFGCAISERLERILDPLQLF